MSQIGLHNGLQQKFLGLLHCRQVLYQLSYQGSPGHNLPFSKMKEEIQKKSVSQFSRLVMSDSLLPHGLQHARPPCSSPTLGVYANSCPLSRSEQISRLVVSNSLHTHESQYARPPCPSPTPGLTQTHVHRVSDAIQPSHPLPSPSPPAPNPSQHQGLFQ